MMSIPMKLTNLTTLNKSFENHIQKCCIQSITNLCPVSSPSKIFMLTFLFLSFVNTTLKKKREQEKKCCNKPLIMYRNYCYYSSLQSMSIQYHMNFDHEKSE